MTTSLKIFRLTPPPAGQQIETAKSRLFLISLLLQRNGIEPKGWRNRGIFPQIHGW